MKKITLLGFVLFAFASMNGQVTIGANSGTNSNFGYPAPMQDFYKNSKSQFLYTAAELSGAGLVAGNITQIGWIATNLNASTLEEGYTISMKSTASTVLTTTFETGATVVYGPTDFTPTVTGNILFTLTTPFVWDGTSNVIIQVCEGATTGNFTANVSTIYSTLTTNNCVYYRSDSVDACSQTTGTVSLNRPQLLATGTYASCLAATALTASGITTTSASISWTAPVSAPANGYDYYYATNTTSPINTTIPSGTVAAGVTTKALTGLSPAIIYTFWVRSKCSSSINSAWASVPGNFTTDCGSSNVPYTIDFESSVVPNLPTCGSNVNEGFGNNWITVNNPGNGFTTKCLEYTYNGTNAANTWFFTNALNLTAGTAYQLKFDYANSSTTYVESLKVGYGTARTGASMINTIVDYPTINTGVLQNSISSFTPSTTGTYYIGFKAYSIADQFNLYVDNINVTTALANNEFNSENFSYYPNPVKDYLNLKYSENISSALVVNLLGQVVLNKSINQTDVQLDLTGLPTGTFLVKLTSDGLVKTIKINKL